MFKNYEEQQKFELWAFGYTSVSYNTQALLSWNSRHGKDLYLNPTDNLVASMEKMINLYEKACGIEDPDLKVVEKE